MSNTSSPDQKKPASPFSVESFLESYAPKSYEPPAFHSWEKIQREALQTMTTLPTLFELSPSSTESPVTTPTGLFQELLHSKPEVLYIDAQEHPKRYDNETRQLLEALVSQTRSVASLTNEERKDLDLATIDFATAKSKSEPGKELALVRAEDREDEAPALRPGLDILPTEMKPFWWL